MNFFELFLSLRFSAFGFPPKLKTDLPFNIYPTSSELPKILIISGITTLDTQLSRLLSSAAFVAEGSDHCTSITKSWVCAGASIVHTYPTEFFLHRVKCHKILINLPSVPKTVCQKTNSDPNI